MTKKKIEKPGDSANIASMIEAFATATERMRKTTAADLHAAICDVLAAHPTVRVVTWTQGTPSYNDGESCTFSVDLNDGCRSRLPNRDDYEDEGFEAKVGKEPKPDDSPYPKQEYDGTEYYEEGYTDPDVDEADEKAVEKFINSLPDDFMQFVLGDCVRVLVCAEGLLVTEHEYD